MNKATISKTELKSPFQSLETDSKYIIIRK